MEEKNNQNSSSENVQLSEITRQNNLLRKLESEIRQLQQTGKVSSWLAGENIKAEAAQNAAQQGGFRQQNLRPLSTIGEPIPVPSIPPSTFGNTQIEETGGGDSCIGLALYTKAVGTPPNTTAQVWVGAGTIAGDLPSGFDPEEGKSIANSGSGDVWAQVNINETTGEITSVAVAGGGSTPNNTNTSFYYTLGYYEYSGNPPSPKVTNYGCGGIDVTVCRNWFAAEAPFYGVTMTRCSCGSSGGGGGGEGSDFN